MKQQKKDDIINNNEEKIISLASESYLDIYRSLKEFSIYAQRSPKSYNALNEKENRD